MAAAYAFDLGDDVQEMFNISEDILLDIPEGYRSVEDYRTTLGHNVNHMFDEHTNVEFDFVDHPVFGVIVCLLAIKDIEVEEELFVNYNEPLEDAPHWYRELYEKSYN